MIKRVILILLLFIPLALAENIENYNDLTSIILDYSSQGEVNLQGSALDNFKATLYLFPQESSRQEVLSLTTNPESEIDSQIVFTWLEFQPKLQYGLNSEIKTKNILYPVKHVSFPIKNLPQEYEQYLQPGEVIDINADIVDKASEIIGGETDMYTAVFKLADWVSKDVKYDLNTVTASAAKKSSWVLENNEGVCDEITSLFISFCRSVGIPARFVSGVAYSNLNYGFENHGWAEVYFPDQGWVPYDVTFKQFGWIDPGHVELDKSLDAGSNSVKYNWRSTNTEIVSTDFENTVQVISQGEKVSKPFNLEIESLYDNVGPGSYVPIKVTVENSYDKYLSNTLSIIKAPSKLEDNIKPILLKPSQTKSTFFLVQIPTDLQSNYVYTAIVEVKDLFGETADTTIEFSPGYKIITEEKALELINELEEKEEKQYSEELSLTCNPNKKYYYEFENITINCDLRNLGNVLLKDVEVCLENNCKTIDAKIGIAEKLIFENVPRYDIINVTAKKDNIDLLSEISLELLTEPDVSITNPDLPQELYYDQDFNLSFVLSSDAIVKDVKLKIKGLKTIDINKSNTAEDIIINTNSKNFPNNKLDITLEYKDEYDREFKFKKQFDLNIQNIPWYAQILGLFQFIL
nr:hypothetical protein [Nanoarchaeum sp.]